MILCMQLTVECFFFLPSFQIGSFGAITRIVSIISNREELLKLAAAGPFAGFSFGLILLLLGFILPPSDGLGIVVDPAVFHESFLVGGIGNYIILVPTLQHINKNNL